jgi:cyclopropane fatty-acyl-phospholipid synthase-like methyltransferase
LNRLESPSTARNREPILAVMQRVFPRQGRVLEIASGTGEHAVFVAKAMPGLQWQPSDPDPASRASIADWTAHEGLTNVLPPLDIDVRAEDWGVTGAFDAVVAINMIHIAPWEATLGLLRGAGRLLGEGRILFLYGPYKRGGRHTAPSNEAFDAWLKERDPEFGVRDLEDVQSEASANRLRLDEIVEMPANNLSLVFNCGHPPPLAGGGKFERADAQVAKR